jgi:molybdenum cofactor cytidylyltransferase
VAGTPERHTPVGGIILAAGLSSRMGGDKVLLPWQGQPLVRHMAGIALASRLAEVVVVTGHRAIEVAAAVSDLPVRVINNPEYATGLSSSLRAGIAALSPYLGGALVLLVDQPLVTTAIVDRLLEAFWSHDRPIVAAVAQGRRGNPVLFARALFPELLSLTGDEGARRVVAAYRDQVIGVEVDVAVLEDIDTPEAYAALADAASGSQTS